MEFSRQTGNVSVNLEEFLNCHERSLPRTVKLVEGFRENEEDETLEADQIFVLHKVERLKVIVALDEFRKEIFFPRHSNFKVHLLPSECNTYSTVQELITDQTLPYILVLKDILSAGIESGSILKILSNAGRSGTNHLKCEVVNRGASKELLLHSHFKGKFLPLLEVTEYSLEEVVTQKQLPVNVRFVFESVSANDRVTMRSLANLGNIRLSYETEVFMVYAASFDKTVSLYVFPKTLEVNVNCGFKVSAETSKKVKECRKILRTGDSSLKQFDDFVANSFYYAASPVRSLSLQLPQEAPPVLPPRFTNDEYEQQAEEKLYANGEESMQHDLFQEDFDKHQPSVSIPFSAGKFQEDRAYENHETNEESRIFAYNKNLEEVDSCLDNLEISNELFTNSNVLDLPTKTRTPLAPEHEENDFNPQSSYYSLPKPRNLLEVKTGSRGMFKDPQTAPKEWYVGYEVEFSDSTNSYGTSLKDGVDETSPDLPPKKYSEIVYDGEEDIPPPLPPKYREKACSEPISRGEALPPVLPPKSKSLCHTHGNSDLPYLVVDVPIWKKDEDNYGTYAEVTVQGCVLKQESDRNYHYQLIGEPYKREDDLERKEKIPVKDNTDLEKSEDNDWAYEKVDAHHRDVRNAYPEVIYQSDETEDYLVPREQKPEGRKMDWQKADDDFWTSPEAKDNDFKQDNVRNAYLEVIHEPDDVDVDRKQGEGEHKTDWEKAKDNNGDYANVKDDGSSLNQNAYRVPFILRESIENIEVQDVVEKSNRSNDEPYVEIIVPLEPSAGEFLFEKTKEKKKKAEMKKTSMMSGSKNNNSKTTRTGLKECAASPPSKSSNIWISSCREEDFMDFKDIEQFFKVRKQLNESRAQAKKLERQVSANEESDERWRRLPMTSDNITLTCSSSKSQDVENGSEETIKKRLAKQKTNFPVTAHGPPERAKLINQERQVKKPYRSEHFNDENDDFYDECVNRKFVSHKTADKTNLVYFYGNDSRRKETSGT